MEKIALVTGASRGIGRAIAAQLAREGWAVCINYSTHPLPAQELEQQLTDQGCRCMVAQADVSDSAAVAAMVKDIEHRWGPVSLLVNNAGISGQMLFQDVTPQLWRRMFAVNVDGAYHTIQAVLPGMLHHHQGTIVNISSIWGLRAASCEVAYSCTKAAIVGLSRTLARELGPKGVRVNCVAPGITETDMTRDRIQRDLDAYLEKLPVGRVGRPEDIANAVIFLASEMAGNITGQVIHCNGGMYLG